MSELNDAIARLIGVPATVRRGKVSSVSPLTFTMQGEELSGVGVLGSFGVAPGDDVALLGQPSQVGSDPQSWLALGAPTTSGMLTPDVSVYQGVDGGSDNNFDWTIPDYITLALVICIGSGGSGGGAEGAGSGLASAGAGGGGGGVSIRWYSAADLYNAATAQPDGTYIISGVAAGGGATTTAGNNNGNNGRSSTFLNQSGDGGGGGQGSAATSSNISSSGGDRGTASGGQINLYGDYGGTATVGGGVYGMLGMGGAGGGGFGPMARANATDAGGGGIAGGRYGGGGSGGHSRAGNNTNQEGARGAAGGVIIIAYRG